MNDNAKICILTIMAILIIITHFCNNKEHFSGSGALVQLYSKGPQDLYLSDDSRKYIFYPRYPYVESVWNNPTRYVPDYNPYRYMMYVPPYRNYVYPFYWY